jgi:hypothetical protein
MEPLNLMVSLSHFANDKPKNQHGLGRRVGTGRRAARRLRADDLQCTEERTDASLRHGWWRTRLQTVARLAAR